MKLSMIVPLMAYMAVTHAMETTGNAPVPHTHEPSNNDEYNTQFLIDYLNEQSGGGIDIHRREVGSSRARRAPIGCSSSAIGGSCSNCNGGGCSAFRCSAFTQWSCPSGYTHCGSEICQGGLCAGKYWCDKN
ncbi:hypothetical protein SARC_13382 [Sphaeroforma arctica JP610]|uniref:Uncharacterized protein n=1 Tax=Sphaeroforma arctica JP610 TaxID=667725 RepID=A0A0L0FBG8_9EUKA|nr:hypothetical protein SARC_13382 [Sphaeroforma arctica JP610]KNC74059.1 hypothetical protein SARC_13382 [Sphaeroforma arctica JP610]|eukprot:XP_014147961.1 hypothetical protein SARC_13382 [Sphaeroforma arctica JP610]